MDNRSEVLTTTGSTSSAGSGPSLDSGSSECQIVGGGSTSSDNSSPVASPTRDSIFAKKEVLPNVWISKSRRNDTGDKEFIAILECIKSDGGWSKCLGFGKKKNYLNTLNKRLHGDQGKLNDIKQLSDKKFVEKFNGSCSALEDILKQSHSDSDGDNGEAFPDHLVSILTSYITLKDEDEGICINSKLSAKQKAQIAKENTYYQKLLLNGNQLPVGGIDNAASNERLTSQNGNAKAGLKTVKRGYELNNSVSEEYMDEVEKKGSRKRKGTGKGKNDSGRSDGSTKKTLAKTSHSSAGAIIQNNTKMQNETLKGLEVIAKKLNGGDDDDDDGDNGENSQSLKRQKFDLAQRIADGKLALKREKATRAAVRDTIEISRMRFEYSKLRLAQYQELRKEARQDMKDFKDDDEDAYDAARKSYLYYGKLIDQVTMEAEAKDKA